MARLTAAALKASPDFEKLLVCDWELARALEEATWTVTAGGAYWTSFTDGQVHKVELDGAAMSEFMDPTTIDEDVVGFCYDVSTSRLYVHLTGDESPAALVGGEPKYSVVAYFFVGFSNDGVVLRRHREMLVDGRLDRWTDSTTPEVWLKTIVNTAAVEREATEVYDTRSAYSAKLSVSATSSSITIYQSILLKPLKPAFIRFKYKCLTTSTVKLQLAVAAGGSYLKSDGTWQVADNWITVPNSTSWAEYSISFNADTSTLGQYYIRLKCETNGDTVYIDNVEMKRYYEPALFLPYLSTGSLPELSHSVGNFHEPEEQLSFGTVKFADDGWFTTRLSSYLWTNKKFHVLLGVADCAYDDLAPMFVGISRQPKLTPGSFTIEVKDARAEFRIIPTTRFNSTDYPNCEDAWVDKPVPICLGNSGTIYPPCCDTTAHKYKVSETHFGAAVYELYSIDNVRKDGTLLATPADYTEDLHNGTFTLTVDPGDSVITCTVTAGIKVDWLTGADSHEAHAWLKFLLVDLNGISKEDISWAGLLQVHAAHASMHREWIKEETDTYAVLTRLKRSAIVQIYWLPNGEINFYALTSAVPSDAQHFYNEDYITAPEINFDTDQCYSEIIGQGGIDPENGDYLTRHIATDTRAAWQQGVGRSLLVETNLDTNLMLSYLVDNYQSMLKRPLETIRVTLPASAIFLNPTDKIYINYSVVDAEGTTRTIYSDQVFIILEIKKNFVSATAEIVAVKSFDELFWLFS